MSDAEIQEGLRHVAGGVNYGVAHFLEELNRRAVNRWTKWITIATIVNVVVAAAGVLVALLKR